jgi:hypothetical protein
MLPPEFTHPPQEFTLVPFWFWNDELDEAELLRQIADFQAHGVHGFVIHPRVGLPRHQGWMSPELLRFMRIAVEEAARRGMRVVLYDEGMYPSGSACGRVVGEDPRFQCRGLVRRTEGSPRGEDEEILLARDGWEVVDRPLDSVIRGLHYVGEGPAEDEPPATDLLNPEAVQSFLRHSYAPYREALGEFFGTTIQGIFTDEPSLLGRPRERDALPGTRGFLAHVERLTGEDLRPRLLELWDEASEARKIYERALGLRLEETYYAALRAWCQAAGLPLMGHPERPDDLAALAYFDVPGQDLVWRWVLPGPTALEGPQSTQAKAAASAARWGNRRRNSNEFAGAYGHELTFEEFKWLVDWCLVRGTNLFFPHAFYYSLRGPRRDERPPDVGPHAPWWPHFAPFAAYCARLSWLNTDCEHVCHVGLREEDGRLPWASARTLFEAQIDFLYVPEGMESPFRVTVSGEVDLASIRAYIPSGLPIESHPNLRVRHVRKAGWDWFFVHNEGAEPLDLALAGEFERVDPLTLAVSAAGERVGLERYELVLLVRRWV